MTKAARRSGRGADRGGDESSRLSARLTAILVGEIGVLEGAAASEGLREGEAAGRAGEDASRTRAKNRIDAIGQLTRTLEKLLDLRRLETLAMRGDADADADAGRLAAEMMKRLRALDARRERPTLFGTSASADPGDLGPGETASLGAGEPGPDATGGAG